jgi:hypothetical protein
VYTSFNSVALRMRAGPDGVHQFYLDVATGEDRPTAVEPEQPGQSTAAQGSGVGNGRGNGNGNDNSKGREEHMLGG